ncbi:hypothetical protein LOTGIDRAFT_151586 [Lottia gigantea]|uniref:MIR domain-containing protein n=1 Tax=Lottia gigantea TaxID=225164 RepID=V4CBE7_LOTGI|nr:hypothetical protein LOTGIDRAFT_151586 [Lottia gigantea]ESO99184.1 hypothetical protein LOTGIDRAFT_151586 [Lottia gigantea]
MDLSWFSVLVLAFFEIIAASDMNYEFVTCGSVLKLMNQQHQVRLHSHDVKYGSGSGQQSVTGVDTSDDHNSYWQIQPKTGATCNRGIPIKCGQSIRLMHLSTQRNLHSHHFQSPLSRNLEVSAFGDEGVGDEGDNWVVTCSSKYWSRRDQVRFKHVVTEHYLHVSGDTFGRPISGQREISAYPNPNSLNYWQAAEGIFVKPAPDPNTGKTFTHDEL